MENLFELTSEVINGPSNNNENPYNYYNKSNREDIKTIKLVLEKWFQEYPISERKELKNRFKKDMDSAFFELFLFVLFKRQGFEVLIHPQLNKTNKRPDFLVSKDGEQIYVEAKISYDKSEEETSFERRKSEFYDNLNKIRIKGYLLRIVELEFKTKKQPSVKELIKIVEEKTHSLSYESVLEEFKQLGFDGGPRIEYNNDDLNIIIQPMPMKESKKNKISKNPIGMFPFETYWGGGEIAIRNSILKKAKRYGNLDLPYLICINALGKKTNSEIDINNVIWGSLQYTFSDHNSIDNGKMMRKEDGIFYNKGKSRLENVSGVFVTKVYPSSIPNSNYWLYQNPFAKNICNLEDLGLNYYYVADGKIISKEGSNFHDIFDIQQNWLASK